MNPSGKTRDFDVIVWGATGFTGRLVAAYLLERYGLNDSLRWAIAGRSRAKLTAVRAELGPQAEALELLLADSHDRASLDRLCNRTRVVCSTVGPFAKYGSDLVASAAATGTDYCDITGEVPWMRRMIDEHEATARQSGARIVHTCGFDSIPSDLGTAYLQRQALELFEQPCQYIKLRVIKIKGTASGGTIASMMALVEDASKDVALRKLLADPYALNPAGERRGSDGTDQAGCVYDKDLESYTSPFVMGSINSRVVRRSHALQGYPWGPDFRYDEAVASGTGSKGWCRATTASAGLGAFVTAAALPPSRFLLNRFVLPKPGQGPNRRQREGGSYELHLIGRLADNTRLVAKVTGDQDPGYGSTSKMLGESAACLAMDALDAGGGFWTPATAMGSSLEQRLVSNAGLTFSLLEP